MRALDVFFPKTVYFFSEGGVPSPNLVEGEFEGYKISYDLFQQYLFHFLLKERNLDAKATRRRI